MLTVLRHAPACLVLLPLAGCAVFQQHDYVRPDGKYDLAKLIRKAEEDEDGRVGHAVWAPLVRFEVVKFEKSGEGGEDGRPAGYELEELRCWGPLFTYVHDRTSLYDLAGKGYEVSESRHVLWRLWSGHRTAVETPHGTRIEERDDLFFGLLSIPARSRYVPDAEDLE
ncbi:MAG: hypothetical protein HY721_16475 [Planctomycetes bacterium]|nr:hypothetical protein [Planctomycetota bacterium]